MTTLLITGSRDATAEMLSAARRTIMRAKALKWTIAVGDAAGVDFAVIQACHELVVPFSIYGVAPFPRHCCCEFHQHWNYHCVAANYLERDRCMVGLADRVFAIWNGVSRGTRYTFEYAQKLGKQVDIWRG